MIAAYRRAGRALALSLAVPVLFLPSGCAVVHGLGLGDKREVYRFETPLPASDPAFRRSLEVVGGVMVDGNAAEILENGDAIFPAMLKDIGEAKVSVNLESYIFVDDEAGRPVAQALAAAARRGVAVRVLVDGTGGKLKGLEKEMKSAGVDVRVYRPVRLYTVYKVGKRTHRKLLVVDGRVGYTGGLGIDARWLGDARNEKEWRDTQVRVAGPVVAQMQSIFAEDWTYTTGEILAGDAFFPTLERKGAIDALAVKASRGDASSLPKMLYYLAIQAARKSIHIENAYFLPDAQVREALIAAAKRGVDVRVVLPGTKIDLPMVRFASRLHYGPLLLGGVKLYEYQKTMLHNKIVVVDGVFSTIGSINFDGRSMTANAEESLVFYDRPFADRLEAMFARDLARSRELTHEAWSRRGLVARTTELVSWLFEPYY
jgi:cardiolipin synthase